jgi:hypothetical protein
MRDLPAVRRAVGSSGITFFGAVGFGQDDARRAGSMSVVGILKPVLLDNVVGGGMHVENNATRCGLIDAHTDELFGFAFGSEAHRSISKFKVGNERRDIYTCRKALGDPGKYFSCGTLMLVSSVARTMVMRAVP